jgi:hypothetical protein
MSATKRLGLFKILVGSDHVIKGKDGIQRQFRAIDKTRHPRLKTGLICLHRDCIGKIHDTEEALFAAHPDDGVMVRQGEAHPYGWWNQTPAVEGDTDPGKVFGLLSDEQPKR